ncbi:MAG: hypothetical protein WDW38_000926 [Sanguina aurantia]
MFKKFKDKLVGAKDSKQQPDPSPTASPTASPIASPVTQPRPVQPRATNAPQPPPEEPEDQEPYYEEEEEPTQVLMVRPRSQGLAPAGGQGNHSTSAASQGHPLTTSTFMPQTLTHMRTASLSLSDRAFAQPSMPSGGIARDSQTAVPRLVHPGGSRATSRDFTCDSSSSTDQQQQQQQRPIPLPAARGSSNSFHRTSNAYESPSPAKATSNTSCHMDAGTHFYDSNSTKTSNSSTYNNCSSSNICSLAAAAPTPIAAATQAAVPTRPPSASLASNSASSTANEAAPLKKQSSFKKLTAIFRRPCSALKPASLLASSPAVTASASPSSHSNNTWAEDQVTSSSGSSNHIPVQSSKNSFLGNIISRAGGRKSPEGGEVLSSVSWQAQQGSQSSSHHTSNSSSQHQRISLDSGREEGRNVRAVGAIKAWEMDVKDTPPVRTSPAGGPRSLFAANRNARPFETASEGFSPDATTATGTTTGSNGVARSVGSLLMGVGGAGGPITGVRALRNQHSLTRRDTTGSGCLDDLVVLAAGGSGTGGTPGLLASAPGVSTAINRMGARANAASVVEELPMGVRRLRVGSGSTRATISRAGSAVAGELFLDSEAASPRTTASTFVV